MGSNGASYITRINLDADAAQRVTLPATKDTSGAPIAGIDGSTWDPFAHRLVFTTEDSGAPIYSATPDYPSTVTDISGALGRSGAHVSDGDPTADGILGARDPHLGSGRWRWFYTQQHGATPPMR